jgi:hypothetical protein
MIHRPPRAGLVRRRHALRLSFPLNLALGLAVALVLAKAPPAQAAGGWQTFIKVKDFTDLLVTQDEIWCATAEAGLLRFERATHEFTYIQREPGSIASNQLTSLAIDRAGRLWVGTFGAGASRLASDGKTWELVNAFDGLPVDSVTTMTAYGDTLWIGTRGGIALWDGLKVLGSLPDGNTVSFDTTFAIPAITGVVQLGDTLWLATPRGVGFARTVTNLSDWRKANAGLGDLDVQGLASDGRTLYALAAGTVYRWDSPGATWISIGFIGIVYSLTDEHGTVLASTSFGLWYHRADNPLFTQIVGSPVAGPALGNDGTAGVDPDGSTQHFMTTRSGLWSEAPGGGPWTLDSLNAQPGNTYSNLQIAGDSVYAATRNEGIGRWDGSRWYAWLPVPCLGACPNSFRNPNEVFAMSVDRLNHKWVGCWGLSIESFTDDVDPPLFEHRWTQPTDDVRHTLAFGAAIDSTGKVDEQTLEPRGGGHWFGMDTNNFGVVFPLGLDYYDSTGVYAGTWGPGSPANSLVRAGKIRAITVDKEGRVWIGYAGNVNSGVDHFVRRPETGYDFKTVANTTTFDVWAMVAHGDSIWVLTDRDLRRISRSAVPPRLANTSYETPAGRPLGMRLMDVAANGDVYVGSEEGVRHYRTDGTTEDFTTGNSPLCSNDVRAVAIDPVTGAVWFGTAAGLNRFDPGHAVATTPTGLPDTVKVWPNPAMQTNGGVQIRMLGTASAYTGAIYDVRGRRVRSFTTTTPGAVVWDGRDNDGNLARPGVYFLRADGGGRQARARFVLIN